MEQQLKPSSNGSNNNNPRTTTSTFDGTQPRGTSNFKSSTSSSISSPDIQTTTNILRATALVLSFIAAIVMSTGKDTARVSITDPSTMKITSFVESVKAKHSSALVYFIVINVLMFLYSASSLAVSFLTKTSPKNLELALAISDILFLILIFSSNSAAVTTSMAIERGNANMGWIKICDAVSSFCAHVTAAIVLSMFASLAQAAIVILQIIGVHYRD